MILWIVLTVMAVAVTVLLTIPLVRRHDTRLAGREASLAVLRDQLRDVDDQERAGTVTADEGNSIRTEIKRRILAEGGRPEATRRILAQDSLGRVAVMLAVIIALAVTGIYALIGRPDLDGTRPSAAAPVAPAPGGEAAELGAMIQQVIARLEQNPDDAEGWQVLGWSYARTGEYGRAVDAYRRAVTLAPDDAGVQSGLGEALVLAADGQVTPEALTVLRKTQALDPTDARARYFLAMARYQAGERKGAIDDWIKLLRDAPPDSEWAAGLRDFIRQAAAEQGIDLAGRLPDVPAPVRAEGPRGPNAADIANAEAMTPQDRQAMIQGMVDGLAARLKDNPRDAEGWERLMRSRMILGDRDGARATLNEAKSAFSDDPAMQKRLADTAASLGI